jgi:hypothetical protein
LFYACSSNFKIPIPPAKIITAPKTLFKISKCGISLNIAKTAGSKVYKVKAGAGGIFLNVAKKNFKKVKI